MLILNPPPFLFIVFLYISPSLSISPFLPLLPCFFDSCFDVCWCLIKKHHFCQLNWVLCTKQFLLFSTNINSQDSTCYSLLLFEHLQVLKILHPFSTSKVHKLMYFLPFMSIIYSNILVKPKVFILWSINFQIHISDSCCIIQPQ